MLNLAQIKRYINLISIKTSVLLRKTKKDNIILTEVHFAVYFRQY